MATETVEPAIIIKVPNTPEGLLAELVANAHAFKRHRFADSWDRQRAGRIALGNCDFLLDYYPDGQHRDDWTDYK